MSQDLNPNPSTCYSLVIFMYWACVRQGSACHVLRSKTSRGKCAKLHTVAASISRDLTLCSFFFFLFAPHIFVCCSSRT